MKKKTASGNSARAPSAHEHSGRLTAFRQQILDLFASARFSELATTAEAAVAAFPEQAFFWKALGVARGLLDERGDRVIEPLSAAARLNPADAEVLDALALALARVGRLDEGLAHGARAVALAPNHAVLQTNYGNLLVDQHRGDLGF